MEVCDEVEDEDEKQHQQLSYGSLRRLGSPYAARLVESGTKDQQ